MIRRVAIAALAALGLAAFPALPAHAREPGLWATINLCDPPAKPGSVGVRVSIPAHGTRKHRQQQHTTCSDRAGHECKRLKSKNLATRGSIRRQQGTAGA